MHVLSKQIGVKLTPKWLQTWINFDSKRWSQCHSHRVKKILKMNEKFFRVNMILTGVNLTPIMWLHTIVNFFRMTRIILESIFLLLLKFLNLFDSEIGVKLTLSLGVIFEWFRTRRFRVKSGRLQLESFVVNLTRNVLSA